ALAGAVTGIGLADSGGTFIPELGITVPSDKAAAVRHSLPPGGSESTERAPVPTGKPDRIPAEMLDPDVPVPISPAVLQPHDAWLVSDGVTLTAVYAGAAGDDDSTGRFVIVRQNLVVGEQTEDVVDVEGSGPLAITSAPRGLGVETAGQHGDLDFRGAKGAKGKLHLIGDAVSREG